jgi:AcrR family transcriptional regulator
MSVKNEMTRSLYANILKEMAHTIKYKKITTQSIVNASGLSKKTFYNLFKNKQDLVNWIFHSDLDLLISDIIKKYPQLSPKVVYGIPYHKAYYIKNFSHKEVDYSVYPYWAALGQYFHANKHFYLNVLDSGIENNFRNYLHRLFYYQFQEELYELLDGKEMPHCLLHNLTNFFTYAFIDSLIQRLHHDHDFLPDRTNCNIAMITAICMKNTIDLYVGEPESFAFYNVINANL